jgi:AcrR family transcriptional regulator
MTRPREKILEMAVRLHAREGLQAVSMRGVAARIGVSPMSLYRHFADREALVDAIAERGLTRLAEFFDEASKGRAPLEATITGFLEFALTEPNLFEVSFLRQRPNQHAFPNDFAARHSRSFELLRKAVEDEMQANFLRRDDTLEVALSIWAHGLGLVLLYRLGRFGNDEGAFRKIYARSTERLLNGLAQPRGTNQRENLKHETTRNPARAARGDDGGGSKRSPLTERGPPDGALARTRRKRVR